MLLHLQNPLKALLNIRSVTGEMAVIATQISEDIESNASDLPLLAFGNRQPDLQSPRPQLGSTCVYWQMNTKGLQEMMEYAGFTRTQPLDPVPLPPASGRCAVVVGYP